ncbi:MAG TPA: ABC transporter substrate-binding protein [Xanthobacteraceae bacterium]|nr:ABC transporter substrate-binding protein [Xanthobacteraceae bacterium]
MSDAPETIRRDKRGRVRRRDFLGIAAGAATWPRRAHAQQQKVRTIGFLAEGAPVSLQVGEFRQGLAEMGYVEGRNVAIEFRAAHNDLSRLRELARDLVRREVDVIVAPGSGAAVRAARAETDTIPIVFADSGDPVTSGLVASLSHPGGNLTGISDFGDGMSAKRLEFMKLLVPRISTVALVFRANNPSMARLAAAAQGPARSLGIETFDLPVGNADELEAAFATLAAKRADGFCLLPNVLFVNLGRQVLDLALRHRVPGVYPVVSFVEYGGLMSYGSGTGERNYQTGIYAGRILNGTKPADLPVYRLTRFQLAINLTTAKALRLDVPATFLALADQVIE